MSITINMQPNCHLAVSAPTPCYKFGLHLVRRENISAPDLR